MKCLVLMGVQNDNVSWNEMTDMTFRQNKDAILSRLDKITRFIIDQREESWAIILLMDIHSQGSYCKINTWGADLIPRCNIPYSFSSSKFPNISFFCVYRHNSIQDDNALCNIMNKFKEHDIVYIMGFNTKYLSTLKSVSNVLEKQGVKNVSIINLMQENTNLFLMDSC
jgi:hypothetical protein